jgi:hypothetical protein
MSKLGFFFTVQYLNGEDMWRGVNFFSTAPKYAETGKTSLFKAGFSFFVSMLELSNKYATAFMGMLPIIT